MSKKPSAGVGVVAASEFRFNHIAAAVKHGPEVHGFTWASKALISVVMLGAVGAPAFAAPGDPHACIEGTGGDLSTVCGDPTAGNLAGGANSLAIGVGNIATGANSVVIGVNNTRTSNNHDTVIVGIRNLSGLNNNDGVSGSVIFGRDNTGNTNGTNSRSNDEVMLGIGNNVNNSGAGGFAERGNVAVGYYNIADGRSNSGSGANPNVAMGHHNRAISGGFTSNQNQSAVGAWNDARGAQASAVGSQNSVFGVAGAAVGANNVVGTYSKTDEGNGLTADGYAKDADGYRSTTGAVVANNASAFGSNNTVTGGSATAVGTGNAASAIRALAMGANTTASGAGSIAIGSGSTTANSARAEAQNAVAIGTNGVASGVNSVALGVGNQATGIHGVAIGVNNTASGPLDAGRTSSVAIGHGNEASGTTSMAIGYQNKAVAIDGVAIGQHSEVRAGAIRSLALGFRAIASDKNDVIAIGTDARGSGAASTAVGRAAQALGQSSAAFGDNSRAFANNSVALGRGNLVGDATDPTIGAAGVAVGGQNTVAGSNAVAVGLNNVTRVANSVVMGVGSSLRDTSTRGVAIGVNANQGNGSKAAAFGEDTIIIGSGKDVAHSAQAGADNAIAIGSNDVDVFGKGAIGIGNSATYSNSEGSIALGTNARVAATDTPNAIAIGTNSRGNKEDAVAIGHAATVNNANAVAIGAGSLANRDNSFAVGNATTQRQIIYVAAGTAQTDAVNVSQLKGVTDALGGGAKIDGTTGAVTGPTYSIGGNNYTTVEAALAAAAASGGGGGGGLCSAGVGLQCSVDGSASATGSKTIALGTNAQATTGSSAIAIGFRAIASSPTPSGDSLAIGDDAQAIGQDSMALGAQTKASGTNSIVIGGNFAEATATGAIAIGTGAATKASATNALALGTGASVAATGTNSVALGAGSVADLANTVSVGTAAAQRRIVNVAAGVADTNAVNVSQLKGLSTTLGATIDPTTGAVTGPTYTVNGAGSYTTVQAALDAAAASGSNPLGVSYDDASKDVITLQGKSGTTTITKVAAGAVGATSTDAINGSQLFETATSVASALGGGAGVDADGKVTAPTYLIGPADPLDPNANKYTSVGDALGALDGAIADLGDSAVKYDDASKGSITLGGGATGTVIGNLANGIDAKDAVNVSQLTGVTDLIGAGAGINPDGSIKAPVFVIGSDPADPANQYSTVGDAFGAVNNALGGLRDDALLFDGTSYNALRGGAATKITGVANGTVSAVSKDAINGSQLHATNKAVVDALGGNAVQNVDGSISGPSYVLANGGAQGTVSGAIGALDSAITGVNNSLKSANPAIGLNAVATNNSAAFGANAAASGANGTAVGNGATATGKDSSVLGANASAQGNDSTALGADSSITGNASTAVGADSSINGNNSVAMGAGASINGNNSSALGAGASVNGNNSVALGAGSVANEANVVSVGAAGSERRVTNVANATKGSDAMTLAQGSMLASALGGGSKYDANGNLIAPSYTVAGGTQSTVEGALNALDGALGSLADDALLFDGSAYNALRGGVATKITGVANGTVSPTSNEAINGSQLHGVSTSVTTALGGGSVVNPDGSISTPTYSVGGAAQTGVQGAVDALDSAIAALGDSAVQYDDATKGSITLAGVGGTVISNVADGVNADDAVNKGQLDAVAGDLAVVADNALQYDAATGTYNAQRDDGSGNLAATRISGVANAINGDDAMTLAQGGMLADALGGGAMYDANGNLVGPSYSIGGNSYGNVGDAFAAVDGALGGLRDDALLFDGTAYNALRGGVATKIVGVANGTVSATSNEAINGSQLHGTATSVATALGGGSVVNPDGSVSAPSYTVAGNTQTSVGGAISALDSQLNGPGGLNDSAVKYDDPATKGTVTFGGANGTKLSNVADGEISATSKDAVNGSQLHATNQQVAANTAAITALEGDVAGIKGDITGIRGDITNIEGDVSTLNSKVDDLASGKTGFCRKGQGTGSVECGEGAEASSAAENAVAIGAGAQADQAGGVAIGNKAHAESAGSIAIGDGAYAKSSVAVGVGAQATGLNTTALGDNAVASGDYAVALGNKANAAGDNSMALGNNASTTAAATNSVALGDGSVATRANSVSVGTTAAGGQRQIVNVAAGVEDTDAVNVSQLKDFKAGAVNYNRNGNGSIDYSQVTFGDPNIVGGGAPVTLSNIAAGVAPNDAVNVQQLNDMGGRLGEWVDEVERNANAGIAAAVAMEAAPYVPGKLTYALGAGYHVNQGAVGLTLRSTAENGRWSISTGIAGSEAGATVRFGVSGVLW